MTGLGDSEDALQSDIHRGAWHHRPRWLRRDAVVVTKRTSLQAAPATTSAAAASRAFVTTHSGTFNGQKVDYEAKVGPTVLTDEKGRATATFYSIAYVRKGVARSTDRPVLFLFNGGPGSASSTSTWVRSGPGEWSCPPT